MEGMISRRACLAACTCLWLVLAGCQEQSGPDEGFEVVTRQFSSAWKNADAHAIAELFTPDATLLVPDGLLLEGRPAIESFYKAAFASGYAGSHVDSKVARTYRFRPNIAIADGEWHIGGIRGDAKHSDERGIHCAILIRVGQRWSIAALREQSGATAIKRQVK
jgi:uncharacterized protein (TIGR02246 family)